VKKKKTVAVVEVKTDAGRKARQEARATIGTPKPARAITERQDRNKKVKHKKKAVEE
jgi:Holliday junction resolvase-like predicted endonuclease